MSIERLVTSRHHRDWNERLLKVTQNPIQIVCADMLGFEKSEGDSMVEPGRLARSQVGDLGAGPPEKFYKKYM